MITYQARTEEFRYVFYDVLNGNSIADLPGFEDATPELFDQLVEAGAKYAQGDCQIEDAILGDMSQHENSKNHAAPQRLPLPT